MNYKTKIVGHQQQYQKWKGLYTKPSSHSTPILYSYLTEQCCRVRPSDRKYGVAGKELQRTIILKINIVFFLENLSCGWESGNYTFFFFFLWGGDFNGLALYLLLQGLMCIMLYWVVTRVLPVYFSGPNKLNILY